MSRFFLSKVQAKYGDYNPDTHRKGFLVNEKLLPQRCAQRKTISYRNFLNFFIFLE